MMLPSHLMVPVGGHRAGSLDGGSDSRVTATGGGLVVVARACASASAMASGCPAAGFWILLGGRGRVIEALARDSGLLVLTTAIPGAATALALFPLWATMTPMAPKVVCPVWLDEVTTTEPVMA